MRRRCIAGISREFRVVTAEFGHRRWIHVDHLICRGSKISLKERATDNSDSGGRIRKSNEAPFCSPERGLLTANCLHHSSPSSCIHSPLDFSRFDVCVSFVDFTTSLTSLTFKSFFKVHIEWIFSVTLSTTTMFFSPSTLAIITISLPETQGTISRR